VSSGLSEFFFYFFLFVQHIFSLVQSCVLLGPADGREWAHKKLVAVLTAVAEQVAAQNLQTLQIAHFNSFNTGGLFFNRGVKKLTFFVKKWYKSVKK
jgi:hypothetical protein